SSRSAATPSICPLSLHDALPICALRLRLAREQQVPPYVIFHDSTLREMLVQRPLDEEAMAAIAGVGAKKLAAYGAAFVRVIAERSEEHTSELQSRFDIVCRLLLE